MATDSSPTTAKICLNTSPLARFLDFLNTDREKALRTIESMESTTKLIRVEEAAIALGDEGVFRITIHPSDEFMRRGLKAMQPRPKPSKKKPAAKRSSLVVRH